MKLHPTGGNHQWDFSMEMITYYILGTLAVWRISHFLALELGPGDIGEKIRTLSGVTEDGLAVGFFAELITCVWCNSVWIGILYTILYMINPGIFVLFCFPFALSAGAIFLEENLL